MPLRVGEVIGETNRAVSGYIAVPPGDDPGTRIPITVITGVRDRPVLALIAGTHGSEPSPIIA